MPAVGRNVRRYEGPEKLSGRAKYLDDHDIPGCWHGVTYRSSVAHAKLKKIVFDPAFPWSEYAVATAADIPHNVVALIEDDQPLLADKRILHPMEPVALVAHPDKLKAYEALKHISLELEELPPVLTMEESLAKKQVLFKDDNVFKEFLVRKGDLDKGFAQAAWIVEGEYRVPHQEQTYIENNAMAAWWEDGAVVAMGSLQCPYYIHKALKHLFNLPDDKVRVIQTTTGGGFGGKEEYPNMIAGHAALLALKAKRPVKIVYDRSEDMAATTKRHPAWVKHRTGIAKDGRLTAQDVEVVMDGGAYATLSAVVLSRGTLHATGPYECPNVRVRARTVATNSPPNGAFRGFGAPQTLFAAELHWEKIARATGFDALELRRKNAFREGSITATGQVLRESVGARESLEDTVRRSGYAAKRRDYEAWNRDARKPTWKGIGLALVHHGAGFTGSGEVYLASRAAVTLTREGEVRVLAASTEIGQGTNTMFSQIAADALGIPYEWVTVETPDTGKVPNSGPTVASRTTMVVGGLVQRAALKLKADLSAKSGGYAKGRAALKKAAQLLCGAESFKRYEVEYEKPKEIVWDDKTYTGDAYGCYGYACFVADLEVDKTTYEVRVNQVWSAQDIGKAVHPLLAEGQIIGGLTQGVGYALYENVVMKGGVMSNPTLTNYIIPTALDTPPMDIRIVEKPYSRGPFGAKGVGELPMDVPGPAIAAAIYNATGCLIPELPILPEKIERALHDKVHAQR